MAVVTDLEKELGPLPDIETYPLSNGRVMKVFGFSPNALSSEDSKQLTEDPFTYDSNGLVEPPFSLERLVMLAESHPTHSASLEQKALDVIGNGLNWSPIDDEEEADVKERTALADWWMDLADGFEMVEVLYSTVLDFETLAWAFLEITRKTTGEVAKIHPVPAHTIRSHRDGVRFCQQRGGKTVWFKRWGVLNDYLAESGDPVPPDFPDRTRLANELLVFRRPSRRSTWYGIPSYISAVGHIALAVSSRDYNILFFNNAREPRHVFTLEGLEEDIIPHLTEIIDEMKEGLKDPHRNLIIPLTGNAKLQIQSLGKMMNDAHFQKLSESSDQEILMSHRMPPDRIGHPSRGPLGGSAALITNRIYKDGVVSKTQAVFEHRLRRFVETEYPPLRSKLKMPKYDVGSPYVYVVPRGDYKLNWKPDLDELDISDEHLDVSTVMALIKDDAITINEGRSKLKMKPLQKFRKDIEEFCRDLEAKEMGRERSRAQMANPETQPPKPGPIPPKPGQPPEEAKKAEEPPQTPALPSPKRGDELIDAEQKKRVKELVDKKRKDCEEDATELDMTLGEYRKSIGGGGGASGGGPPPPQMPMAGQPMMKQDWSIQDAILDRLEDLDDVLYDTLTDKGE